jgi:hypothetical protein
MLYTSAAHDLHQKGTIKFCYGGLLQTVKISCLGAGGWFRPGFAKSFTTAVSSGRHIASTYPGVEASTFGRRLPLYGQQACRTNVWLLIVWLPS